MPLGLPWLDAKILENMVSIFLNLVELNGLLNF
jgi:hypothetical protein